MQIAIMLQAALGFAAATANPPQQPSKSDTVSRREPLVLTSDTTLDPQKEYGQIVIAGSNITIDGRGAILDGGDSAANKRQNTAIMAEGQDGVVIKNLTVRGWQLGLRVVDAEGWEVTNCDFSDNFHDPEFGWGEQPNRGGIVFERVHNSIVRNVNANRVWDACVLIDSNDNRIENCDFSYTSNTGLKLWHACQNQILDNRISHAIRIRPGEVHARDSTGVLIESGSDANRFERNDCTHGGDGIFVRVLNGWCSTGNTFVENDCSYANNNGFECWAPRNTFIANKANHCSYGFWMGGSDKSQLIGNEASYNGLATGFHNSPHLPDSSHAGIVFMFGSSSHVIAMGNRCVGNRGAGIALLGDQESEGEKWKAYHWIIQSNSLRENRWGIFAQYADWLTLSGNYFEDNAIADIESSVGVTRLTTVPSDQPTDDPNALSQGKQAITTLLEITGPRSLVEGQQARFEIARDSANDKNRNAIVAWDLGSGNTATGESAATVFNSPGLYRVGATSLLDRHLQLGYLDVYVTADAAELADDADSWGFFPDGSLRCKFENDRQFRLVGEHSTRVRVDPYHGERARIYFPRDKTAGWNLGGKQTLGFWWKSINPNLTGWQFKNPEITLYTSEDRFLRLTPNSDLLQSPADSEAREGWRYFSIPLRENPDWQREGNEIETVNYMAIGFDSWGGDPLTVWIDGVVLLP
jgi:parallel beta-helix repeat protein